MRSVRVGGTIPISPLLSFGGRLRRYRAVLSPFPNKGFFGCLALGLPWSLAVLLNRDMDAISNAEIFPSNQGRSLTSFPHADSDFPDRTFWLFGLVREVSNGPLTPYSFSYLSSNKTKAGVFWRRPFVSGIFFSPSWRLDVEVGEVPNGATPLTFQSRARPPNRPARASFFMHCCGFTSFFLGETLRGAGGPVNQSIFFFQNPFGRSF